MTATIVKHCTTSNSKGHRMTGCFCYRVKLPAEAAELLGCEVIVRKHPTHYELTRFGKTSEGKPAIITKAGVLTVPNRLVEEYEDLIEYMVDIDHENEIVNLVRK